MQSYNKLLLKEDLDVSDSTALAEMLKFLYNVTFHIKVSKNTGIGYADSVSILANSRLVSELAQLLLSPNFKGYQPPLTNVVHCLLNLPLANSESDLFPSSEPAKIVQRLVDILDRSVPQDTDAIQDKTLDEHLSPVVGLLNNILEVALESAKEFMKESILPSETYI